ncbi:MAG TPA: hypothetical protein VF692_07745 [Pyrinomonadaceae bacterium]
MKNISVNKTKFQKYLDALIFTFNLFFGIEPETETAKPYIFVSPALERRRAVERAALAFELKKGGVR